MYILGRHGTRPFCDKLNFLVPVHDAGARDQKEVKDMNKYELVVVISSKLEEEERAASK